MTEPNADGKASGKWAPEDQIKMLEKLERMERAISSIFEAKGLGPVRFTTIDWYPNGEETK